MATKCATLLILAVKLTNHHKEPKDIMKVARVTPKDIQRFYKRIQNLVPKAAFMGQTCSKYAEQASKQLGLNDQVTNWIKATADNIQQAEVLTGKKPATIAGVALWVLLKRLPA